MSAVSQHVTHNGRDSISQENHRRLTRLIKKKMHSTLVFITIIGVATGQIRQKTFKAMKIAGNSMCILDNPSRSLLVGKLKCSFECTAFTGCDYFNVLDPGEITNSATRTCQLFKNKPSFLGKMRGCTAYETTASSCQPVAAVGSAVMTLSPPYCCNVLFTGQLETRCLSAVYAGNGCSNLTSDKNVTCSPNATASFPYTTSVATLPALSIGQRILLQNKVPSGSASVSFNVGWTYYANGFGQPSLTNNYWIGNEKLYTLTSGSPKYCLRFEIQHAGGGWLYAEYDSFVIGPSSTSYPLTVFGAYSGNAGDALRNPSWSVNGRIFGTPGRDSRSCMGYDCSGTNQAGWWWACCTSSNVNADGSGFWVPAGMTSMNDVVAARMYAQEY